MNYHIGLSIIGEGPSSFICAMGLDKQQLRAGACVVNSCLFTATIASVQVGRALQFMAHPQLMSFTSTVTVGHHKLRKQVSQVAELATYMQKWALDEQLATIDLVCFG